MNRRAFISLSPAFPVAAVSASLVLRETGKQPVELDVSVLKLQQGDTLVIQRDEILSDQSIENIKAAITNNFPGTKALVLTGGLKLTGVLRGV